MNKVLIACILLMFSSAVALAVDSQEFGYRAGYKAGKAEKKAGKSYMRSANIKESPHFGGDYEELKVKHGLEDRWVKNGYLTGYHDGYYGRKKKH